MDSKKNNQKVPEGFSHLLIMFSPKCGRRSNNHFVLAK
jgi:hypothetical protein